MKVYHNGKTIGYVKSVTILEQGSSVDIVITDEEYNQALQPIKLSYSVSAVVGEINKENDNDTKISK
jgi:hypothetical protein